MAALIHRRASARGALLLAGALSLAPASAQTRLQASEHQVKAAFLINFAELVEWPQAAFESREAPLRITVLGSDPMKSALETAMSGRRVGDHPLRLEPLDRPPDARGAHILFVGNSEREQLGEILAELRGANVLTVGETPGFAARGGIINFFEKSGKIRFEINKRAAEEAGLRISSRLLRLARIVGER